MWLESTWASEAHSASRSRPCRRRDKAPSPELTINPPSSCVDDDRASLDLLVGLPRRFTDAGGAGPRRRRGARAGARAAPAAVVLDIRLPRLDGWQVLAELKADRRPVHPGGRRLGGRRPAARPGPGRGRVPPQASPSRRAGRRPAAWVRSAYGVVMSTAQNPGGRGQPAEPQAGSRRPPVRRLRRHGGPSGEEGLRAAQADPPDLVLMDLQLPGIDGVETLQGCGRALSDAMCRSSQSPRSRWPRTGNAHREPASTDTSRSRSACEHCPARWKRSSTGGRCDGHPATVLAVDDQPANLRLLDAVLTPRGYRVLTARRARKRSRCSRARTSTSSCSTS